jgi:membrane protein DedA with SNARE-associated domain
MEVIDTFWEALRNGELPNLGWWSYLLVALLVILEGPVSTMLGAAAASAGFLRLPLVYVVAVAANLAADVLWYLLGRAGKVDWLLRYGGWLGLRRDDLDDVERELCEHPWRVLLVSKLTNILVTPTLVATGLARVEWRRWVPPALLGTLVITGVLILIGYISAEAAKHVQQGLECLTLASPIAFVLIVLWFVRRRLRRRHEEADREK